MSNVNAEVIRSVDMGATITGSPTVMPGASGCSVFYIFKWPATGSPIGTLGFDVTGNYNSANPADPNTVWVDSGFSILTHPNGTADDSKVLIPSFPGQAIRPKYTRTSGGSGAALRCWVNVRTA